MSHVQLGNVRFALDGGAPGLQCREVVDWYKVTKTKTEARERPTADGAFAPATAWRESLALVLNGWWAGASLTDMHTARTLLSTVTDGVIVPLRVVIGNEDTTRLVHVMEITLPAYRPGTLRFDFTIDCVAFDPLRYGAEQTVTTGIAVSGGGLLWPLGTTPTAYWDWGTDSTSGRVTFTNTGNAPVFPNITATGSIGGFLATHVQSGRTVQCDRVIPDGSTVTVVQRAGTAYLDTPSNDVTPYITRPDYFAFPPGTHTVAFTPLGTVTGEPVFGIIAASAWR